MTKILSLVQFSIHPVKPKFVFISFFFRLVGTFPFGSFIHLLNLLQNNFYFNLLAPFLLTMVDTFLLFQDFSEESSFIFCVDKRFHMVSEVLFLRVELYYYDSFYVRVL